MSALVKWPANVFIWKVHLKVVFLLNNSLIIIYGYLNASRTYDKYLAMNDSVIYPISFNTWINAVACVNQVSHSLFAGCKNISNTQMSITTKNIANESIKLTGLSYIAIGH